jgi:hypothetical protein
MHSTHNCLVSAYIEKLIKASLSLTHVDGFLRQVAFFSLQLWPCWDTPARLELELVSSPKLTLAVEVFG